MKPYQERLKNRQQQVEFTDGRMSVEALFANMSASTIITTDRATVISLRDNGQLDPNAIYHVTDALFSHVGTYPIISKTSQGVLVSAVSSSILDECGKWLRTSHLVSYGMIEFTGGGGTDSIDSIMIGGSNMLSAPVVWNTDLTTTLADAVTDINATLANPVTAYSLRDMLVLYYKVAGEAPNGTDIDAAIVITDNGGGLTKGKHVDFMGGADQAIYSYDCVYDIDSDHITEVHDCRENFTLRNKFQAVIYEFPYEASYINYYGARFDGLIWTNAFFKSLDIQAVNFVEGTYRYQGIVSLADTYNAHRTTGMNSVWSIIDEIVKSDWQQMSVVDLQDSQYLTTGNTYDVGPGSFGSWRFSEVNMFRSIARVEGYTFKSICQFQHSVFESNSTSGAQEVFRLVSSTGLHEVTAQLNFTLSFLGNRGQLLINDCDITSTLSYDSCRIQGQSTITYNNQTVNVSHAHLGVVFDNETKLDYTGQTLVAHLWRRMHFNGNMVKLKTFKTGFTGGAGNGAAGSNIVLLTGLPQGFIPTRRNLKTEGLTSGTSTAELSLGIATEYATGLMPATVITSLNQVDIEGSVNLPNLGNSVELTQSRDLIATPTVENITAGSIEVELEGFISQI